MFNRIHLIPSCLMSSKARHFSPLTNCAFSKVIANKQDQFIVFRCKSSSTENESSISKTKENDYVPQITVAEKVKQTTKDAGYLGIIIAGVSVTGIMFYAILRELFSGQSPNGIYSDAFKLCKSNSQLVDILGEPIQGYGELSSRGRRRHVSHLEYEKDGKQYMRMKFYVKGVRNSGTVHLEMVKENKKYEYRYLFVDIDGYQARTVILKDNRHLEITPNLTIGDNPNF